MKSGPKLSPGFTLIELMIAVIVVGILAAVAMPSYLDFVQRGRRADAYDAVTRVQQEQERFRSQNLQYAATMTALKLAETSAGGHYRLALSDVSELGYKLTVTPTTTGKQVGDRPCRELTVVMFKASHQRSSKDADGADSTSRCWPQ